MTQPRWIWRCDHQIPSQPGAAREVRHEVLCQLQKQNWLEHDIFCIHLALEEALVNALEHGNVLNPDKTVHIACRISPNRVRIEVADEGPGFDPHSVPDPTDEEHRSCPRGRGVMLMRSLMDRVEYNERGNRVVLEKRRSKPS